MNLSRDDEFILTPVNLQQAYLAHPACFTMFLSEYFFYIHHSILLPIFVHAKKCSPIINQLLILILLISLQNSIFLFLFAQKEFQEIHFLFKVLSFYFLESPTAFKAYYFRFVIFQIHIS